MPTAALRKLHFLQEMRRWGGVQGQQESPNRGTVCVLLPKVPGHYRTIHQQARPGFVFPLRLEHLFLALSLHSSEVFDASSHS